MKKSRKGKGEMITAITIFILEKSQGLDFIVVLSIFLALATDTALIIRILK